MLETQLPPATEKILTVEERIELNHELEIRYLQPLAGGCWFFMGLTEDGTLVLGSAS